MQRIKTLVVFGTRPEAIKMAPVVRELRATPGIEARVCVTGQHRQMLDSVLEIFGIVPDFDLDLMRERQTLDGLTANVVLALAPVLEQWRPDRVVVHGDTTTTMAASLASFYQKIPVAHVEAGLRTGDRYSPWPEEMNRVVTGRIADLHFAPTDAARRNLLGEGVRPADIIVCGNTVIDALLMTQARLGADPVGTAELDRSLGLPAHGPLLLMTGHRRENFGANFAAICRALQAVLLAHPQVTLLWPLHLNPAVRDVVREVLGDGTKFGGRLRLVEPLDYLAFTRVLGRATVVLTDSGGIQEETAALGKPTLVLRDTTERPEAVAAGTAKIVGADEALIASTVRSLLEDPVFYASMGRPSRVFGDGTAAHQIAREIARRHGAGYLTDLSGLSVAGERITAPAAARMAVL